MALSLWVSVPLPTAYTHPLEAPGITVNLFLFLASWTHQSGFSSSFAVPFLDPLPLCNLIILSSRVPQSSVLRALLSSHSHSRVSTLSFMAINSLCVLRNSICLVPALVLPRTPDSYNQLPTLHSPLGCLIGVSPPLELSWTLFLEDYFFNEWQNSNVDLCSLYHV